MVRAGSSRLARAGATPQLSLAGEGEDNSEDQPEKPKRKFAVDGPNPKEELTEMVLENP